MPVIFQMVPGLEINLFLLVLLSFAIGIISGFTGVGGGFLMTPALIILGLPAQIAVGTSLIWVMANSIVGAMRHRQHGNVDFKLGLTITAASMAGVEIGSRCLQWALSRGLADETVLAVSILVLLTLGSYTVWESLRSLVRGQKAETGRAERREQTSGLAALRRLQWKPRIHFARSGITISLWVVLGIGLFTGTLAGLMGVGGGFIMVPSLIYVVGLPSFLAVGTDLFQIIFSSAYGAIRNTMHGNVLIFAAFIMILSSAAGVQCGVLGTRLLKGVSVRLVLSLAILVAVLGAGLKLINTLMGNTVAWMPSAEKIVTFGGLGLVLVMIGGLFLGGIRLRRGQRVPAWFAALGNPGDR